MGYTKPELIVLVSAMEAIQGTRKQVPHVLEVLNNPTKPGFTVGAYEQMSS